MRIIAVKDYNELSRATASLIAAQVVSKPDSVLGLATGSSPIGTYQKLIEWYKAGALDFSACSSLNLDEYVGLTPDNDQSYAYFMRDRLFDHINIDLKNTNIPDGMNPDPAAECARYDALIHSLGGIDLQLLGIGPNGHIGFNEPGEAFSLGTQQIELTASTREANKRFFASLDDVPTHARTTGTREIMQARRVLLVASGANKAQAVKGLLSGPVTPHMPCSILQYHPDCIVVADEAALSAV